MVWAGREEAKGGRRSQMPLKLADDEKKMECGSAARCGGAGRREALERPLKSMPWCPTPNTGVGTGETLPPWPERAAAEARSRRSLSAESLGSDPLLAAGTCGGELEKWAAVQGGLIGSAPGPDGLGSLGRSDSSPVHRPDGRQAMDPVSRPPACSFDCFSNGSISTDSRAGDGLPGGVSTRQTMKTQQPGDHEGSLCTYLWHAT